MFAFSQTAFVCIGVFQTICEKSIFFSVPPSRAGEQYEQAAQRRRASKHRFFRFFRCSRKFMHIISIRHPLRFNSCLSGVAKVYNCFRQYKKNRINMSRSHFHMQECSCLHLLKRCVTEIENEMTWNSKLRNPRRLHETTINICCHLQMSNGAFLI